MSHLNFQLHYVLKVERTELEITVPLPQNNFFEVRELMVLYKVIVMLLIGGMWQYVVERYYKSLGLLWVVQKIRCNVQEVLSGLKSPLPTSLPGSSNLKFARNLFSCQLFRCIRADGKWLKGCRTSADDLNKLSVPSAKYKGRKTNRRECGFWNWGPLFIS